MILITANPADHMDPKPSRTVRPRPRRDEIYAATPQSLETSKVAVVIRNAIEGSGRMHYRGVPMYNL
jgi:hypothetical protein